MAYPRGRRTPLKRRRTYGRGTKQYRRAVYRRAYYNKSRGVGRKEKKGCDLGFATETILASTNTNGGMWLLNGIQEGVGSWNRIGRYIWNKSVELDLNLRWDASYAALDSVQINAQWVRCIVVWDKQPNNGSIPTFETIFGHTSQNGAETSSVNDHLRYDNMFRFKVLLDTQINPTIVSTTSSVPTNPTTAGLVQQSLVRYHKYLKLGNKMTNFSGTANPVTTANISTGALYLILRAPTNTLNESWYIIDTSTARLRYVD